LSVVGGFVFIGSGLGQRIVIRIAGATNRCRDPFQHKGFRERDRRILPASPWRISPLTTVRSARWRRHNAVFSAVVTMAVSLTVAVCQPTMAAHENFRYWYPAVKESGIDAEPKQVDQA
jgi:hypothetical protein